MSVLINKINEPSKEKLWIWFFSKKSGAAGDRSLDLIHAKHTLYHWATTPRYVILWIISFLLIHDKNVSTKVLWLLIHALRWEVNKALLIFNCKIFLRYEFFLIWNQLNTFQFIFRSKSRSNEVLIWSMYFCVLYVVFHSAVADRYRRGAS